MVNFRREKGDRLDDMLGVMHLGLAGSRGMWGQSPDGVLAGDQKNKSSNISEIM